MLQVSLHPQGMLHQDDRAWHGGCTREGGRAKCEEGARGLQAEGEGHEAGGKRGEDEGGRKRKDE